MKERSFVWAYIVIFFLLTCLNWFLEIKKWKTLISHLHPINITKAAKESLTSFTAAIITPNRIGEYGAKAMFYPFQVRKKVLVLTLISNLSQLFATLFFGSIGVIYLLLMQDLGIPYPAVMLYFLSLLGICILGYLWREKTWCIQGLSLQKIWEYAVTLPTSKKWKVLLLSTYRYLTFSLLFYGVLYFFGAYNAPLLQVPQLPFVPTMATIFSMYLLVSIVPTLAIFDITIKGGVAIWLFSLIGIAEIPVLCTVLIMWLLNVMIPALLGSVFIASYKKVTA